QLLERLRQGQCSYEDYELLLTLVVGQPTVSLREPPWNQALMLVFRKEIRTQLNHRSAIHNAVEVGCGGAGTCEKLLELSDSKTEHLPSSLPLVPGMPVIITQNIAIKLGLINGVNGIFRQLVYDLDSVSTDSLSKTFPMNTQYVHKPIYALVEISKSKIECNLKNLQPKLVPIPIIEQTFQLPKDTDDIAPVYVPLSRVKRLSDLIILRHFDYKVLLIKH
ncbi:unnamed protein product, partial [Adineta ricciae]